MDKAMLYEVAEMAPTGAQYVQISYGRPCGVYYRAVNDQVEMANSAGFFSWQPAYFSALDLSKMLCKGDVMALPMTDQPEVTEAEEEAWQRMDKEQSRQQYSAYYKDVRHIEYIDVYRTVDLFGCEKHGHAISHAAKKLLLTGARTGGKDVEEDVREAIDSLYRWLEMREEDKRAL